jgi:hypothetical protein
MAMSDKAKKPKPATLGTTRPAASVMNMSVALTWVMRKEATLIAM